MNRVSQCFFIAQFNLVIRLLLLLLFSVLSTSLHAQITGKIIEENNYKGVLCPAEFKHSPQDSVARWTPTEDEIRTLEHELNNYLDKQPKNSIVNQKSTGPSIHKSLRKYIRQYTGYISPEGEKMIYLNCFWDEPENLFRKDYDRRLIQVFDGGSYYWQAHYNVQKHKFVFFSVNGVA